MYRKVYILYYTMLYMEKIVCKYCGKKIEGHTKKQIKYLLSQHILSKHSDKIKWMEIDEEYMRLHPIKKIKGKEKK